jgi:hypothetical protein
MNYNIASMKKALFIGIFAALAALIAVIFFAGVQRTDQPAAPATTLLNQGQTLATAWQAYKTKNSGQPAAGIQPLLEAKLLPSFPAYPAAAGGVPSAPFSIAATGATWYAFADAGAPTANTPPGQADPNAALCQRLNDSATQKRPAAYAAEPEGQLVADRDLGNGTYGCGIVAGKPPLVLPGSGLFPVIGHYTFFYKLG